MKVEIPNYFLADLGPEAEFTESMITEACLALRRNRERYLAVRDTGAVIRILSQTAENWLEDDYPYRELALEKGPEETGFSRATLKAGLDHFFNQLTGENLEDLLLQELGHFKRMDSPASARYEGTAQRASATTGSDMLLHIAAGNIPLPAMMSIVLGLLTRSSQFVKCASGSSYLPRLFAHSLYETDSKIGACIELAEWKGGNEALEKVLFHYAESVTATGSDETLEAIEKRLPRGTRFVGHGHRVSFGYVTKEAMGGYRAKRMVRDAADDVVAWNQLGCLSPHVFYVEDDSRDFAYQFAEMLAGELAKREKEEPRGEVPQEVAEQIASRRSMYEVRAAHLPDATRHWYSEGSTAWSVIYETDTLFQLSCMHRFIYVKSTPNLEETLKGAETVRDNISTVGLGAGEDEKEEIVMHLARWGVSRVCALGQMQKPPLTWRHDGRPLLSDLVRWTDWEQ
ncbi:MAG: hypothetical protein CMO80_21765 [Verrucomicrobiales bacterium]|nr:hypothetical protein [Verrucomicrobiales bacterium]|tara:strand:+ start:3828 stop:5198 length:1371 start_codon:yes stop_codon:yes gene_type:complete